MGFLLAHSRTGGKGLITLLLIARPENLNKRGGAIAQRLKNRGARLKIGALQ